MAVTVDQIKEELKSLKEWLEKKVALSHDSFDHGQVVAVTHLETFIWHAENGIEEPRICPHREPVEKSGGIR